MIEKKVPYIVCSYQSHPKQTSSPGYSLDNPNPNQLTTSLSTHQQFLNNILIPDIT